jgi:hypothetical protein
MYPSALAMASVVLESRPPLSSTTAALGVAVGSNVAIGSSTIIHDCHTGLACRDTLYDNGEQDELLRD